jgi:hypothetical protein
MYTHKQYLKESRRKNGGNIFLLAEKDKTYTVAQCRSLSDVVYDTFPDFEIANAYYESLTNPKNI